MNKFCIAFAGPVGSSKTPIANYLSYNLNLPVFNKDAVRTEVTEDLLTPSEEEVAKRVEIRVSDLLKMGNSFILDGSMDRSWPQAKEGLLKHGYSVYLISLDFSKELLVKLYEAKGYTESLAIIDKYIADHSTFKEAHSADINLALSDENFPTRLDICLTKVRDWLKS